MTDAAPPNAPGGGVDALFEAVTRLKKGDALAPVAVVTPSVYSAVATRRALALAAAQPGVRAEPGGGGGVANVECTTPAGLVRSLAAPVLARQELRAAPAALEREAIRTVLAASGPRWRHLAGHPGALAALQRTFAELRRWTLDGLEAMARNLSADHGGHAVHVLLAVRDELHRHGLADTLDERTAALEALSRPAAMGPLALFDLGPMAPAEDAVVAGLGAQLGVESVRGNRRPATELRPCADPEEEARAAVRAVLAAAEAGTPLWRQAVLHPPGERYGRLVEQVAQQSGLVCHGPGRRHLEQTMPGRALRGLLDLLAGDFARDAVLGWLSSAPLWTGPDGRPVPVSRWQAVSADAGVVRGLPQWRERLERVAARGGGDAAEAQALLAFVEDLAARAAPGGSSWTRRAEWAVALLDRYLALDDGWPLEQRLSRDQVSEAVLALGELDTFEAAPDAATFRRAVDAALHEHTLDMRELGVGGVGDGVFVGPFGQARGMAFDVVAVVGLADAVVPGSGAEDPLLPDEVRRMDLSGALRNRARRQQELCDDVAAALGAGAQVRLATFPRVDPRSGREQTASRFLDELTDAATTVRKVDSFAASLRQGGPALSATELTLRVLDTARRAGTDPATTGPVASDVQLAAGFEAVRSRAGRTFTRFDGNVGPGRVTPFDPEQPVSATRLETYAECPRRYLFERVLGVHERTLPEDLWRIEARDRGSLVHAILEQYLLERIDGAARSLDRLLAIASEHLDEAGAGGRVGKSLLWRLDRAAIERDLRMFHAEEHDLEPLAAEFSFGVEEHDSAPAVAVQLVDGRTVRFRGRADRVDRDAEGALVVSDYKTGRQAGLAKLTSDPVVKGRRLQLPLYAMAARSRFATSGPVRARYWMVSAERATAAYNLELTDELERHFSDVVALIALGIEDGLFPGIPGAPRDTGFDVCLYCDFDRVCPATRDRQWATKRGAPELDPLNHLLQDEVPDAVANAVVRASTLEVER
ncbi:MAG TPA: PD-(D/E)XK nuclease family protein [Acidimicrobiales bacterium]|nr:PD-(D/E)XK nuclease family protein [Acidimicrobiales bacterium]